MMQRVIWVLWPSFIVAGIAEAVFFTLIDPDDLRVFDHAQEYGRMAVYSVGFFGFWVFAAASSALTCFFQRSAAQINRCPLAPTERPVGCPRREERGLRC